MLDVGNLEKVPTGKFPAFQFPTFAQRLIPFSMPTQTTHRFTLQPYAGPKSRITCPACGKPRRFTRYLDTDTGEVLPDEYGRCDREANCGYHRNPYHREAGSLSYARQMEGDNKLPYRNAMAANRLVRRGAGAPAPATVRCIPTDVYTATLGSYKRNNLVQMLRGHFGRGVADELLRQFQVGTSAYWPGACVFWLLDTHGRVRGGQVVHLDETGHTVKQPWPGSGDRTRRTDWIHTALSATYRKRGTPPPTWFADYKAKDIPKSPCLFGLPQLDTAPPAQPVAVVESAKTAMLATPYLPRYVWLATMGQSYLTPDRMEPLRGRHVVLFPDAGATTDWQRRADELRRLGFNVQISDELERLATDDERRAGLDLADVLLREWPGYPPNWDDS